MVLLLDVRTALLALLSVVTQCSYLCGQVNVSELAAQHPYLLFSLTQVLHAADKTHTVDVSADNTVQDVKAIVEAREGAFYTGLWVKQHLPIAGLRSHIDLPAHRHSLR